MPGSHMVIARPCAVLFWLRRARDDHEVREENEVDNEWLRKRRKACEDPLAGSPPEGAVRDGRAAL